MISTASQDLSGSLLPTANCSVRNTEYKRPNRSALTLLALLCCGCAPSKIKRLVGMVSCPAVTTVQSLGSAICRYALVRYIFRLNRPLVRAI